MPSENKFGLLRKLLRAFGLSQDAVDDIVNWIADLLAGKNEAATAQSPEFPYRQREHFLTSAELSFFMILKTIVGERAALSAKVGLGDLFVVKTEDQSRYRVYTNKIDRKHVDFLLCDLATMRPLVGIELDDSSHQRADRQARDEFVDQVFAVAGLPILHVPAKRTYVVAEVAAQLAPYLGAAPESGTVRTPVKVEASSPSVSSSDAPICPKCGGQMVLRIAKSGANAGNRFWGCSNYPNCRSMLPYEK